MRNRAPENGNGNGTRRTRRLDAAPASLCARARQVAASAASIARSPTRSSDGADAQTARSTRRVAGVERDRRVAEGDRRRRPSRSPRPTEELVSSINEMAASIEQVSANTASLAGVGRADGARRSQETTASIQTRRRRRPQEMATAAQQVTTSIDADGAASIRAVSARHRVADARRSNETAAAIEEMSRVDQGRGRQRRRSRGRGRGDRRRRSTRWRPRSRRSAR